MVLGEEESEEDGNEDGEEGEDLGGGYTIGGDMSFYEWDFTSNMPSKNVE